MNLGIYTKELSREKGTFIALVSNSKYDGDKVGCPGSIKYGDSHEEAYGSLKTLLEGKGHNIIDHEKIN